MCFPRTSFSRIVYRGKMIDARGKCLSHADDLLLFCLSPSSTSSCYNRQYFCFNLQSMIIFYRARNDLFMFTARADCCRVDVATKSFHFHFPFGKEGNKWSFRNFSFSTFCLLSCWSLFPRQPDVI